MPAIKGSGVLGISGGGGVGGGGGGGGGCSGALRSWQCKGVKQARRPLMTCVEKRAGQPTTIFKSRQVFKGLELLVSRPQGCWRLVWVLAGISSSLRRP